MGFRLYTVIFICLFCIDYVLGNRLMEPLQNLVFNTFKTIGFLNKSVNENAVQEAKTKHIENPMNIPIVLLELLVLYLVTAFLQKYKDMRGGRDRIEELLQEVKEGLRSTNYLIDQTRIKQTRRNHSYFDDEQKPPLKIAVPILEMAIVDTKGTSRTQPERGDAGDTIDIMDSTLLSVSSLVDDPVFAQLDEDNI